MVFGGTSGYERTGKTCAQREAGSFRGSEGGNHTNKSTVWARVRKYAQEHVEGPKDKTATGEGGSESESGGAQHNRSLTLRFVEELTLLFKAGQRAQSMSDKERNAHTYIGSALGALGIDLATL